jgi:hypothetical protein
VGANFVADLGHDAPSSKARRVVTGIWKL